MKKSLDRVLKSNRVPSDPLGYRDAGYSKAESRAIVNAAFIKLVEREPQEKEIEHWSKWLRETRSNSDSLRCGLMSTPEFIHLRGYVNPLKLHKLRNDRWLKMILKTGSEYQPKGQDWPNARQWNEKLLEGPRN